MDAVTQRAINDWAYFCLRKQFISPGVARIQTLNTTILPDSDLYNRLIWATVHAYAPKFIATQDDYNDPRIKEALNGRINFIQFQAILEQSRWKGLTPLGKQMQKYLDDPRVFAFLDMIARAEAWFRDPGVNGKREVSYNEFAGFTQIPNLYQYPGRILGRYQIDKGTWSIAQRDLGLYDFTQESQDIAAVYQLYYRPSSKGNILSKILDGDIAEAIERGNSIWASFPDEKRTKEVNADINIKPKSHYGDQPAVPLNDLLITYERFLNQRRGQ